VFRYEMVNKKSLVLSLYESMYAQIAKNIKSMGRLSGIIIFYFIFLIFDIYISIIVFILTLYL
jgi:hypothetical protein